MPFDKFQKEKAEFLRKKDKSRKGSRDRGISLLLEKINSHPDYYTTSSCSGRVLLLTRTEKKHETQWLFLSHTTVAFSGIKKVLRKLPKKDVWFKQEPAIFHIACRSIGSGQKLVNMVRNLGFRRSGIQATQRKIIVEVVGTDAMDTIIAKGGELVVDENYLKILLREANKKMKRNEEKLKSLSFILPPIRNNSKKNPYYNQSP